MIEGNFRTLLLLALLAVGQSAHIARRDASFQHPDDEDNEIGWNGGDQMAGEDSDDFRPYSEPDDDFSDNDGELGDKDGNFPGIFDEDENDGELRDKDGNFPGIFNENENDDDKDEVPYDQSDEDDDRSRLPVPFGGGLRSFFDNPFFNLKQVREYFRELEKALERTFSQTLEEAKLLNGTYANTTEEEVVIGGKKFIVQKSVIKGRDNNSVIYVETLTSKAKGDGSINGMEVKNETEKNVTTAR